MKNKKVMDVECTKDLGVADKLRLAKQFPNTEFKEVYNLLPIAQLLVIADTIVSENREAGKDLLHAATALLLLYTEAHVGGNAVVYASLAGATKKEIEVGKALAFLAETIKEGQEEEEKENKRTEQIVVKGGRA